MFKIILGTYFTAIYKYFFRTLYLGCSKSASKFDSLFAYFEPVNHWNTTNVVYVIWAVFEHFKKRYQKANTISLIYNTLSVFFLNIWVSFLKPILNTLPIRVRGLKLHIAVQPAGRTVRRTLCGCVDWNVWDIKGGSRGGLSHPMRERGLKSKWRPFQNTNRAYCLLFV